MELTLFGWYWLISSVIACLLLTLVPTRPESAMSALENIGGSAVLAMLVGWLIWPVFIYVIIKVRTRP